MRSTTLLVALGVAVLLSTGTAFGDCNHPATDYERRDCDRQRQWDYQRGNSEADRAFRNYRQQLERQAEEEQRQREEEERKSASQGWRPLVSMPGEYEGQRVLREARERYAAHRAERLKVINGLILSMGEYGPGRPGGNAGSYRTAVQISVPLAGEMLSWAEKGYGEYGSELAGLYGFMIAADPCADNPNQFGYPLANNVDMSNIFYDHLNRDPFCTYGRMYKAIPYLLEAKESRHPQEWALACAQIDAWIARHFDNGKPVVEPKYFGEAVYNERDYQYLTVRLAQCRADLPHAAAFEEGLFAPARAWVKKTNNYFSDVRLIHFYDPDYWARVTDYDDPRQIRAVFDDVIKDFGFVTKDFPGSFPYGIDARGNGWHAYR